MNIYKDKELGVVITHGVECGNSCYCKYKNGCKYGRKYAVSKYDRIRHVLKDRFNICLPLFVKEYRYLSGTCKCPNNTTVETQCCLCKNCGGVDEYYHLMCGLRETVGVTPTFYDDECWRLQCKNFKQIKEVE